jgi:predicted nucleic-acid-binding protein
MGPPAVKVTADTNVLVRAITDDDPGQARSARKILSEAELVALPLAALCELVWVLRTGYGEPNAAIAAALRALLDSDTVAVDRLAVEFGLQVMEAGGDFADGVIAYGGQVLGAVTFVSFDRKAVELIASHGGAVRLLA